jgi:hypothetical protein
MMMRPPRGLFRRPSLQFSAGALRLWCLVLTVSLVSGVVPVRAAYDTFPQKVDSKDARSLERQVASLLRDPSATLSADNKKVLDEFLAGYFFPSLSDYEPDSLGLIGKKREVLFRRYIDAAKSPAIRDYLVELTRKAMSLFCVANYHPAVRYNAVLVLASLDKQPAAQGNAATPPVPLPEASNVLLLLLENEKIKNVTVPSSVRVAALVGLERHARFGLDEQFRERLTKVTSEIMADQEKARDVDLKVHNWMRCLAARVAAQQFTSAPDPAIHEALVKLVNDSKLELVDRCTVARQIARIKYEGVANIDAAPAVLALGKLAVDVVESEAKLAADYQEELLEGQGGALPSGGRGGGFGGGYGGEGGYGGRGGGFGGEGGFGGGYGGEGGYGGGFGGGYGGGYTEPTGPKYERRRLLRCLTSVTRAIKKIEPIANENDKERLASLHALLQSTADVAAEKDALDVEISQDVIQLKSKLAPLVAGWGIPAAAAPDADQAADDAFAT